MLHQLNRHIWLTFVTLLISVAGACANPFIYLESSYEGDGWFQYKVRLPVDPYWEQAFVGDFSVNSFDGIEEVETPSTWSCEQSESSVHFTFINTNEQVRPVEYTFRVKSSYHYFKLKSPAATFAMSLTLQDWFLNADGGTIWSKNIVGFLNLECLVPCSEAEADGSASSHTVVYSIIPDVRLDQVLIDGSQVTGLMLYLPIAANYQVEGSANLKDWHTILTTTGISGTNICNSPDLASNGPFYRALMIPVESQTTVQSVSAQATAVNTVKSASIHIVNGALCVVFPSEISKEYQIEFLDTKGVMLKTVTYTAVSSESAVSVPQELDDSSVMVRVKILGGAAE